MVVASPAAIVGRWLASGQLSKPGVCPPETSVPPEPFYEALAVRGVTTTLEETTTLAG
jgi:saccharopine dehydrogenase-like NADP-dependent oxidoreductase